jgi:predicted membrane protein
MGERTWQPSTVAELRDTYDLGMGQLTIDLSQLALEPGDDITVESTIGIGQLEVDVPPDSTVSVIATGNGSASVFNRSSDGTNYELAHTREGPEGSPTIELVLSTGLGNIDVQDGASPVSPPLAPPGVN